MQLLPEFVFRVFLCKIIFDVSYFPCMALMA